MKRRDFLRWSAGTLLGVMLGEKEMLKVSASYYEPMIYKRFLQFTEYEERKRTEVLVIHHTGFPNVDKDSTVTAIHKYHQETMKWAGVGYHYLIRKDGMIEQGRQQNMVGAHAYGHNKNSLGICLAGNFDIGRPTAAQMEAVKELCRWLCQKYKLDPLKKGTIVGHRDLNDTACPGKRLYRRLEEIRYYCAESRR
ncbi:MAG: N-acetylmuramoyl-L-alanine amidase [Selenomonas sp.]|nr:N-acetylmuramoyl-L-alanine amidase [Selenomonas sp.]